MRINLFEASLRTIHIIYTQTHTHTSHTHWFDLVHIIHFSWNCAFLSLHITESHTTTQIDKNTHKQIHTHTETHKQTHTLVAKKAIMMQSLMKRGEIWLFDGFFKKFFIKSKGLYWSMNHTCKCFCNFYISLSSLY